MLLFPGVHTFLEFLNVTDVAHCRCTCRRYNEKITHVLPISTILVENIKSFWGEEYPRFWQVVSYRNPNKKSLGDNKIGHVVVLAKCNFTEEEEAANCCDSSWTEHLKYERRLLREVGKHREPISLGKHREPISLLELISLIKKEVFSIYHPTRRYYRLEFIGDYIND